MSYAIYTVDRLTTDPRPGMWYRFVVCPNYDAVHEKCDCDTIHTADEFWTHPFVDGNVAEWSTIGSDPQKTFEDMADFALETVQKLGTIPQILQGLKGRIARGES